MKFRFALGALLIALSLTAWLSTTQAESRDACEAACQEEHQQCIEVCGQHSNPVECDSDCRDAAQDCHRRCN
jgi:hypothetical protein